jgi:hypothetical protein
VERVPPLRQAPLVHDPDEPDCRDVVVPVEDGRFLERPMENPLEPADDDPRPMPPPARLVFTLGWLTMPVPECDRVVVRGARSITVVGRLGARVTDDRVRGARAG